MELSGFIPVNQLRAGSATPQRVSLETAMQAIRGSQGNTSASGDLLIYVNVPFCSSKCLFCDWVADVPASQLRSDSSVVAAYARAVNQQIRALAPYLRSAGYRPRLAYWGGGTPSKLGAGELESILETLHACLDLSGVEEHTMETSPETITPAKLEVARKHGVNRISMGVQSFADVELRMNGRAHSAAQAEEAIGAIRKAGFTNFNIDLMIGMPGQADASVSASVSRAIELDVPHVSVYLLRASPDTILAAQLRHGFREAQSLEGLRGQEATARRLLTGAGYQEYMFGYFARSPQNRFRGERYYFGFEGDFAGLGCGAESILGRHYLKNYSPNLHQYIGDPTAYDVCDPFQPDDLTHLFLYLRLALLYTERGIVFEKFERLCGYGFSRVRNHPHLKSLLDYCSLCGAEFVEDTERLAITNATRGRTQLHSVYWSMIGYQLAPEMQWMKRMRQPQTL